MIVGRISDIATQRGALPGAIVRALEALQKVDLGALEPGRRRRALTCQDAPGRARRYARVPASRSLLKN